MCEVINGVAAAEKESLQAKVRIALEPGISSHSLLPM